MYNVLMFWMLLATIAALIFALNTFIDNALNDNYFRRRNPGGLLVFTAISYVLTLVILIAVDGGFELFLRPDTISVCGLMLGGALNMLANIPYLRSLKYSDATELTVFWQLGPVMSLVLGMLVLNEHLNTNQLVAFCLIFAAAFFLVHSPRKKKERKVKMRALFWVFMTCLLWILSDVFFALEGRGESFASGLAWFVLGSLAMWGVLVLVMKDWRKSAAGFLKERQAWKLTVVGVNLSMYVGAEFAYRAAIMIAPIAMVSVFKSVTELLLTFVLGIVLSVVWPKFGREKIERGVIYRNLIAVVMVAIGIFLLQ